MAKKKRSKRADHSRAGDRPRVVRSNVEHPTVSLEDQPLIRLLNEALDGDHPLDLLAEISTMMAATEPSWPSGRDDDRRLDLAELTEGFFRSDFAPITAALHVMATYTQDERLERRIRSELAHRSQPMPAWLRDLSKTEVVAVHQITEPFPDGEVYLLDVRLPDGYRMTANMFVDNGRGEVVIDGLVVPVSVETVAAEYLADIDLSATAIDGAEVRARIEQALALGENTVPPRKAATWPDARPLVRWLVSLLPYRTA